MQQVYFASAQLPRLTSQNAPPLIPHTLPRFPYAPPHFNHAPPHFTHAPPLVSPATLCSPPRPDDVTCT